MIVNINFEFIDHEHGADAPDAKRLVEILTKTIPEGWWEDRDIHWTLVEITEGEPDRRMHELKMHEVEMHELLIEMDKEYGTLPESPLHHDRRCPIHGTKFSDEPPAERGVNP